MKKYEIVILNIASGGSLHPPTVMSRETIEADKLIISDGAYHFYDSVCSQDPIYCYPVQYTIVKQIKE